MDVVFCFGLEVYPDGSATTGERVSAGLALKGRSTKLFMRTTALIGTKDVCAALVFGEESVAPATGFNFVSFPFTQWLAKLL